MSQLRLFEYVATDVPTPPANCVALFVDADTGYPAFKNDAGDVFVLTGLALTALAALTPSADKVPYFDSGSTAALADFTTYARTLVACVNAAAARSALGLAIGTDVQAYDAELAAIAGLVSAANKIILFTGPGTASLLDFSTDGTFASNSDTKIPSEKAIKTYVDAAASGATYTDEKAQDAVGAALTDTTTIDFTYNDGANTITADIVSSAPLPGSPTTTTQSEGDNSTKIATTAYADRAAAHAMIPWVIPVGDETTAITTGAAKVTFRMPYACKMTQIPRANLNTVSSSGNPAIDINKNGTTIFSTTLTIDASEKTSVTAATAAVLTSNPTTFADDDEITIDIDTAGTGAKGLKITLYLIPT